MAQSKSVFSVNGNKQFSYFSRASEASRRKVFTFLPQKVIFYCIFGSFFIPSLVSQFFAVSSPVSRRGSQSSFQEFLETGQILGVFPGNVAVASDDVLDDNKEYRKFN